MYFESDSGVLEVDLRMSGDILYASMILGDHEEFFQAWIEKPKVNFSGRVDVDVGRFGAFGFAIHPLKNNAYATYNEIVDLNAFLASRLYLAIEEFYEYFRKNKDEARTSRFESIFASLFTLGPLFICESRNWYPGTIQEIFFSDIMGFKDKAMLFKSGWQ